jgi:hypothetical protein
MRKKPSLFRVAETWGGGEILVSEMKRISGDWSLISLLRVQTAAGLPSPLQFQDKIFIDVGEA